MSRTSWVLLVASSLAAQSAHAIDFGHYHSQDEIDAYLAEAAAEHASLAQLHLLGYSQGGRPIRYLVVSRGEPADKPALYLNGAHHGDEKTSAEAILGLVELLTQHPDQPEIQDLLSNYAIYLQPLVNPDGFASNSRFDAEGRDPNRDYAFPGRRAKDAFKIPSTRLVAELMAKVRFRAAAAFHAGMEAVLWAWAFGPAPAADQDVFFTLAHRAATAMGMSRFLQSYADYPTQGEFIDYAYMTHGTLALTLEVSDNPQPPPGQLRTIVKRAVAGGMAFMLDVLELDRGTLPIERPTASALARAAALPGLREGSSISRAR